MAASPAHRTLVAATVTTITFDDNFGWFEVTNVDGADAVYVSTTGVDPTVAGDGFEVVTAAAGAFAIVQDRTTGNSVVKLISAGTPKVSVRGL